MPVRITCPGCKQPLGVGEDNLGKPVKCPTCGHAFVAPTSAPSVNIPPRPTATNKPAPTAATKPAPAAPPSRSSVTNKPAAKAPARPAAAHRERPVQAASSGGHGGFFWFCML